MFEYVLGYTRWRIYMHTYKLYKVKSMPGGEYKEMSNRFLALRYPGV